MKEHIDVAKDFIDFISESPTKYHAIENVKSKLLQHKFESLSIDEKMGFKTTWKIFYRTGQLGINCILHEFS